MGPALPGVSVRAVDTEKGTAILDPDVVGSLEISGPNVFAGYWQDPEKTGTAFTADGWFKTEDLGRIERDGYVYSAGRAKDLVISGGCNVYPKEVESELDAVAALRASVGGRESDRKIAIDRTVGDRRRRVPPLTLRTQFAGEK